MPTDIVLDEEDLTIDAADTRLHIKAADVTLSSVTRQSSAGPRRAFVHGEQDDLILNFSGDYPGGVQIHGDQGVYVHGHLSVGHPVGPGVGTVFDKVDWDPIDGGLIQSADVDLNAVFHELHHQAPLDVQGELNILRSAVLRLLERVELLEAKP